MSRTLLVALVLAAAAPVSAQPAGTPVDPWAEDAAPPAPPPPPSPAAPVPAPEPVPAPAPDAAADPAVEPEVEPEVAAEPAEGWWIAGARTSEPPPPPRYPLALAERPLVLPSGTTQASLGLSLAHRGVVADERLEPQLEDASLVTGGIDARFALGHVEVGAHTSIALYNNASDRAMTNTFRGGGADVTYGFGDDWAVYAAFHANVAWARFDQYVARLGLYRKLRLWPRWSLVLGARVGDRHVTSFDERPATDDVVVAASVAIQAQLSPRVAWAAGAFLGLYHVLDPVPAGARNERRATYLGSEFGVSVLAALSPGVDLVAGIELVSTGSATVVSSLSVVLRRVP